MKKTLTGKHALITVSKFTSFLVIIYTVFVQTSLFHTFNLQPDYHKYDLFLTLLLVTLRRKQAVGSQAGDLVSSIETENIIASTRKKMVGHEIENSSSNSVTSVELMAVTDPLLQIASAN